MAPWHAPLASLINNIGGSLEGVILVIYLSKLFIFAAEVESSILGPGEVFWSI